MNYKVMLVDDEMIILSGIRHMIDWQSQNMEVVASARNGKEALEKIETCHPDIIISDLKMPVMDGIGLLKACNELHPEIVFIILTSLEDFKTAKDAIRYNAIDYLLKTEMDEKNLSQSLRRAKEEYKKRSALLAKDQEDLMVEDNLKRIVSSLFRIREIPEKSLRILESNSLLSSYAIVGIHMDIRNPMQHTDQELLELLSWLEEICEKILPSFSSSFYRIEAIANRNKLIPYLISGIDERSWHRTLSLLGDKIVNAAGTVLGLDVKISATKVYSGLDNLVSCRNEFERIYQAYYLEKDSFEIENLDLARMNISIEKAIAAQDRNSLILTMNTLIRKIATIDHAKAQAITSLEELLAAARSGLSGSAIETEGKEILRNYERMIPMLSKRSEVLEFLESFKNEISDLQAPESGNQNPVVIKAKLYISNNISKPLSLADVADSAFVSPAYLSALFKKQTGQSFVEYVNASKIEKAKEMMEKGKNRVDEIALSLGFDNIYYFSKVFKKITGISPSEYMKKNL